MKLPYTLAAAIILSSVPALAQSAMSTTGSQSGLQYSYFEFGFAVGSPDTDTISDGVDTASIGDAAIWGVNVSAALNDFAFLEAGIQLAKQDITATAGGGVFSGDLDTTVLYVGIGAHHPIQERVDVYGVIGLAKAEQDLSIGGLSASADDSGLALRFGLRAMATETLELGLAYSKLDLDDTDASDGIGGELRMHLTERVSLGAQLQRGDDFTTIGVGARFGF